MKVAHLGVIEILRKGGIEIGTPFGISIPLNMLILNAVNKFKATKKYLNAGIISFLCICTAAFGSERAYAHPFDGDWTWGAAPTTRTFSIELRQQGKMLKGQYCAVARNGGKVDCDNGKNLNLEGVIDRSGKTALVRFSSFFGAKEGKAKIVLQDDHLLWHITRSPGGGEFYAPNDAVLNR